MHTILKEILQKNNINYKNIAKQDTDLTHQIFYIDNNYIVKIASCNDLNLGKEIKFYKKQKSLTFIPTLISCGTHKKNKYLIVGNIKGDKLFKIWHTISNKEQVNVIIQISQILKNFHALNYKFLPKIFISKNWIRHLKLQFKKLSKQLENINISNTFIKQFTHNYLNLYFKQSSLGLVYNNASFNNIIYENGIVKIFNFDKILYCPIDYELLIINCMCKHPFKFIQNNDTSLIEIKDYNNLMDKLKKYYPKLFEVQYLNERLVIYEFLYSIEHALRLKQYTKTKKLVTDFIVYFNLKN